MERRKLEALRPYAAAIFGKAGDPALRGAAAGALFAIGDESPGKPLLEALESDMAIEAVEAARVLIRYPGKGDAPLRALFVAVDGNEAIGRAKPTILALVVEAVGETREPGARKLLEGLLDRPDLRADAARSLGALGDPEAVPALVAFLRAPPPDREGAASGGLGFLGRSGGVAKAAAAEEVRPLLAGALAVLRCTGAKGPR